MVTKHYFLTFSVFNMFFQGGFIFGWSAIEKTLIDSHQLQPETSAQVWNIVCIAVFMANILSYICDIHWPSILLGGRLIPEVCIFNPSTVLQPQIIHLGGFKKQKKHVKKIS